MRLTFSNKIRIFLVVVLALLVAGMTILGVLGFNQTVDNSESYEMQVSVDQVAGDSVERLRTSSEEAINSLIGGNYFVQEENDGAIIVYKFNDDVTAYATEVEKAIQTSLDASTSISGVQAEVNVYKNLGNFYSQTGKLVLAVGIAVAVIFVYALIMNKLSGGVAVLCSSVLSVLLFTALMAMTRIPAQPYFGLLATASVALSSAIALALTTKYKALSKIDNKNTAFGIVESVNKSFCSVYIALAIGVVASAVIAGLIGMVASIYLGLAILVAGISGIASAIYMTPLIWSAIKGKKK